MTVLAAFAIWLVVSVAFTPLVGFFLGEASENAKAKEAETMLHDAGKLGMSRTRTPSA